MASLTWISRSHNRPNPAGVTNFQVCRDRPAGPIHTNLSRDAIVDAAPVVGDQQRAQDLRRPGNVGSEERLSRSPARPPAGGGRRRPTEARTEGRTRE